MPIIAQELKMYRSAVVSDGPSNGGVMSTSEVVSGVSANLFPNVSSQDRANGVTQYRKLFMKVANIQSLPLLNPRIWQDSNTPGQDRVTFFPGSQSNTQGALTGVEPKFGMGYLAVGVSSGGTSIQVEVEDPATPIFTNSGTVRISNRENPSAPGDEVFAVVQGTSTVGNIVTLTLQDPLPVGFLSGAKVSSVYFPGSLQAAVTGVTLNSPGGATLTTPLTHIVPNGVGSLQQTWTLTFTTSEAYDVVGSEVGPVGSGNIFSTFQPLNQAFGGSAYFFRIFPQVFSGTAIPFAPGDTITFITAPAAAPLWLRRVVPAGCPAVGANSVSLYIDGETT